MQWCVCQMPEVHTFSFREEQMDRVNIHLTDSQVEDLRIISEKMGIPRSELVRRAIDQYIESMSNRYNIGITGIYKSIQ